MSFMSAQGTDIFIEHASDEVGIILLTIFFTLCLNTYFYRHRNVLSLCSCLLNRFQFYSGFCFSFFFYKLSC